jgi:hypothetical protein
MLSAITLFPPPFHWQIDPHSISSSTFLNKYKTNKMKEK